MQSLKKDKLIRSLRQFRIWHRYIGLVLSVLLVISAITGVLLAWKKNVDLLQPPSQKGISTALVDWKSFEEVAVIAVTALADSIGRANPEIDRMDARPSKGMIKVLFSEGNWEVQVDGTSGEVLSIAKRHSDWIENLHDGSIISEGFKLISMNTLGIGLLFLIAAGVWLWYGPKKIKKLKNKR
ncbi:MAG: PepSY-associated TM helix domain-containing protein [Bacteroidota bacterium]